MIFPTYDDHASGPENSAEAVTTRVVEKPTLEYCSADVLLEIMSLLDCKDILRLRQISRRMNAMSRLRPVWERLAIEVASTLLTKRVDLYTSQELENAVIQHAQNRVKLLSAKQCILERTIFLDKHTLSATFLVPGGRWFIKNTSRPDLGVVYADLHDPHPHWRQLIPQSSSKAIRVDMFLDNAYDASDGPSFHLMLHETSELPVSDGGDDSKDVDEEREFVLGFESRTLRRGNVSIWEASPTFDSDGNVDGLAAKMQFSRPYLDKSSVAPSLELQGQHLLFTMGSTCSVVRWMNGDGRVGDFPPISVYYDRCSFGHLLTERWLLVGSTFYWTCAIFDLSKITLGDIHDPDSTPEWSGLIEGDLLCWPLPPPRIVGSVLRQIIPLSEDFLFLEFDLDCDTAPPNESHIGAEHPYDIDGAISYSRDTLAYYDKRTLEPYIFIFDSTPLLPEPNDLLVPSSLSFIALPFEHENDLGERGWQVRLDAHNARLIASYPYIDGTIHYIYSFSAEPISIIADTTKNKK